MNESLDYSQLSHLQGQVTDHKLDDLSKTYCSKRRAIMFTIVV